MSIAAASIECATSVGAFGSCLPCRAGDDFEMAGADEVNGKPFGFERGKFERAG